MGEGFVYVWPSIFYVIKYNDLNMPIITFFLSSKSDMTVVKLEQKDQNDELLVNNNF